MMDNKEDFQLIDVRESHEHELSHLSDELIPMHDIVHQPERVSREKKVVIYCRSGSRSGVVVNALEKQFGFDNLYNLKGGIKAWSHEIDPAIKV